MLAIHNVVSWASLEGTAASSFDIVWEKMKMGASTSLLFSFAHIHDFPLLDCAVIFRDPISAGNVCIGRCKRFWVLLAHPILPENFCLRMFNDFIMLLESLLLFNEIYSHDVCKFYEFFLRNTVNIMSNAALLEGCNDRPEMTSPPFLFGLSAEMKTRPWCVSVQRETLVLHKMWP